jgi:subtilisin family serine protease
VKTPPEEEDSQELPGKNAAAKDGMRYTGKGIKVGVIDGGIDMNHRGFRGRLGKRIKYGKSYNSGCTLQDVDGHGTHVAGIIGAQDLHFQGVAPDVEFGVYNVVACKRDEKKSSSSSNILRALEDAKEDGMNIINMSLGGLDWEEGALGQTASRMFEQHNILVITSNGNRGGKGLFKSSGPGVGRNVMATGACKSLDSTKENMGLAAELFRSATEPIRSLKTKLQGSRSTSNDAASRRLSRYSASLDFKCDDMANFTSWGPTPEFGIKPEVSAPVSLCCFFASCIISC